MDNLPELPPVEDGLEMFEGVASEFGMPPQMAGFMTGFAYIIDEAARSACECKTCADIRTIAHAVTEGL